MSKVLNQISRITASVSTSTPNAVKQLFSTSAPDPKTTRDGRSTQRRQPQLSLPAYDRPSQIKYDVFVQRLEESNRRVKAVSQAEAQKALRQYFINFFGREDFEDVRTQSHSVAEGDKDKAAWSRLLHEGEQYWNRRRM